MIRLTALAEDHGTQLCLEQLAGLLSWGSIASDGTVSQQGSGDWYPVRNSAGSYTILFRQPKGMVPAVTVSSGVAMTHSVVAGQASFTAVFGAPTDVAFSFVALGA